MSASSLKRKAALKLIAERAMQGDAVAEAALRERIRAFHGSPADFEKFMLEFIGTGEGNQAYGWGLYFAENPAIATTYRDTLSKWVVDTSEGTKKAGELSRELADRAVERSGNKNFESAINQMADKAVTDILDRGMAVGDVVKSMRESAYSKVYAELADELEKLAPSKGKGKLYEVNIDADKSELLDWDAPLSEQSDQVKAALLEAAEANPGLFDKDQTRILQGNPNTAFGTIWGDMSGQQAYKTLVEHFNRYPNTDFGDPRSPEAASKMLGSLGIKGIKYSDATSRGTDGGTSNFVIFDPRVISIAKKYGVTIPVAATMMASLASPEVDASTASQFKRLADLGMPESTLRKIERGELPLETALDRYRQMGYDVDNPVYHASRKDFTEIDPNEVDIGLHMGTYEQAENRMRDTVNPDQLGRWHGDLDEGETFYPLIMKRNNPLEMDDIGAWNDSETVGAALQKMPQFKDVRETLFNLEDEINELRYQFDSDRDWLDSTENKEILAEMRKMIEDKGYDSIKYKNQVENRYGSDTGLRESAMKRKGQIGDEISYIEEAIRSRMPERPLPDVNDPDAARKVQEWLKGGRPKIADYATPEEAARLEQLRAESMQLSEAPENYNDPYSWISLGDQGVKSLHGVADPDEASNPFFLAARPETAIAAGGIGYGVLQSYGKPQFDDEFDPSQPSGIEVVGKYQGEQDVYRPVTPAQLLEQSKRELEQSVDWYEPSDPEDFDVSRYRTNTSPSQFMKNWFDVAGEMGRGTATGTLGSIGDTESMSAGLLGGIVSLAEGDDFLPGFAVGMISYDPVFPTAEDMRQYVPSLPRFGDIPEDQLMAPLEFGEMLAPEPFQVPSMIKPYMIKPL